MEKDSPLYDIINSITIGFLGHIIIPKTVSLILEKKIICNIHWKGCFCIKIGKSNPNAI